MAARYAQKLHIRQVLSPADITETATGTQFVNMENAHWITFAVAFGTITGDSVTVTVEVSTGTSTAAGDTVIPAQYRLSGAVAADSWGAVTALTTAGVIIGASDDDKLLLIDVDPATIPALDADATYIRCLITPGSTSVTALEVQANVMLEPRYPQLDNLTST
jgi:hypothetical protein